MERTMARIRLVRDINQARALVSFSRQKSLSRAQLARELKLTRSTASALAAALIEDGLVVEDDTPAASPGVGRPGLALRLNPDGASFLGAEFNSEHMTVVGLRLDGQVILRKRQDILGTPNVENILNQLYGLVQRVSSENSSQLPRLQGLGVAIPGMLERDGAAYWIPSLRWKGSDLHQDLESRLGMPVIIDNDANASVMAELLLRPEPIANDFLYILLDHGIGSGIVRDRTLYRGAHGISGETGHMRLDPNGITCPSCGGIGCFATLVSNYALVRFCRESGGKAESAAEVIEQASAGGEASEEAVRVWLSWLARGIATLLFVLDPGEVVLGGTLAGLMPDLPERLTPLLEKELGLKARDVELSLSAFGQDGAAVGAAALVYQNIFHVPSSHPDDADVLARA
jgi:predicted NBD/HSP70 family sugar kinase